MQNNQLFTDLAHIAYAGYVPKNDIDRIAGKPSWQLNDSGIHPEWEVPTEKEPLALDNDLTLLEDGDS